MTSPDHPDPLDMLGIVEASPDQWEEALAVARASDAAVPSDARAVVVAGMGGSGIAADVASTLVADGGNVPVVAVRDYRVPTWCGPDTPVVAISHSGGTEETLAATRDALERGCPVLAITSGGELGDLADETGSTRVTIPAGGQPRASCAFLTVPLLVALERGGHLPGMDAALATVPDELRARRRSWGDGPREVAQQVGQRVPVFVGGAGLSGVVAHRARCQVNENAERLAFEASLPESDHNAIVGWGGGPAVRLASIEILDEGDHPRTRRRFDVTAAVLADDVPCVHRLELAASTPVGRLAEGMLWVDLLSVHLALHDGTDPTPVARIVDLKQRMAAGPETPRVS